MKRVVTGWLCAGLLAAAAHADEKQAAGIDQQSSAPVPAVAPAPAQAKPAADAADTVAAVPATVAATSAADRTERAQPLTENDLDSYRAGASTVTATQTLTANTSQNTLNGNYVAGSVTLSDEALSNFNGFGNFAINTGAQVSIQSAMNVTINIADEAP